MSESWVISCSGMLQNWLSLSMNFYKSFLESFCLCSFILSLEKASWVPPDSWFPSVVLSTYSGRSIFLTLQLMQETSKKAIVDPSVYIHSIDTLSQKFLSKLNSWKVYSASKSSDLHRQLWFPRSCQGSQHLLTPGFLPSFLHISVCVTDVCQHPMADKLRQNFIALYVTFIILISRFLFSFRGLAQNFKN